MLYYLDGYSRLRLKQNYLKPLKIIQRPKVALYMKLIVDKSISNFN